MNDLSYIKFRKEIMSAQNAILLEKQFIKYRFKDMRPQSKNEYHL